jgi:CRISPR-associated protein Cas2
MTVVVTRNVPERFRGFLASCMLELAPGVYTGPDLTAGVRERIWNVCCDWAGILPSDGGVLMTWSDERKPGGQAVLVLGWPRKELVELDGLWLDRRELCPQQVGGCERGEPQPPEPERPSGPRR